MFWKKKKKMIDVRDLQKKGMRIPQPSEQPQVTTDNSGFIDMNRQQAQPMQAQSTSMQTPPSTSTTQASPSVMSFLDNPSTSSSSMSSTSLPSRTTPSEDLRKISEQISNLDNKLYKIEQRIELLERKAGVNDSGVGPAGW